MEVKRNKKNFGIEKVLDQIRYFEKEKKVPDLEKVEVLYSEFQNRMVYKELQIVEEFKETLKKMDEKEGRIVRESLLESLRYLEKKPVPKNRRTEIRDKVKIVRVRKELKCLELKFRFFGCQHLESRGKDRTIEGDKKLGAIEDIEQKYRKFIMFMGHRYSLNSKEGAEDLTQEGIILLYTIYNKKHLELGEKAFAAYFKASLLRLFSDKKKEEQKRREYRGEVVGEKIVETEGKEIIGISEKAKEVLNALKDGWTLQDLILEEMYTQKELDRLVMELEEVG